MNFKKVILSLFFVALCVINLFYKEQIVVAEMDAYLVHLGWQAPLVFCLLYVVACVLFIPGSSLTLMGGALFGPWWGALYSLLGATIGSTVSFFIARYLASNWVRNLQIQSLQKVLQGVEKEGWKFVAFTRLVPLFPFSLLNYALGLSRISTKEFIWTSFWAMTPGAFLYNYLGYLGKEALIGSSTWIPQVLFGIAIMALVWYFSRLSKRKYKDL